MMRKLLQPLESEDVDNFIDDILVASASDDDNLKALEECLRD